MISKQRVLSYKNSTLIYQKNTNISGYSVTIGFSTGQNNDNYERDLLGNSSPDMSGLTHLIEHLILNKREGNVDLFDKLFSRFEIINGKTGFDYVNFSFSIPDCEDITSVFSNIVSLLTRKGFTKKDIDNELNVIANEHESYDDILPDDDFDYNDSLVDVLTDRLAYDDLSSSSGYIDVFNKNLAKNVSPKDLDNYIDNFFNLDNLVCSVVTNHSLKDILYLFENTFLVQLDRAKSPIFNVDFADFTHYDNKNMLLTFPVESSNTEISFVFRDRFDFSENEEREVAYDLVKDKVLNSLDGPLYKVMQKKNPFVYKISYDKKDVLTSKFSSYNFVTNRKNVSAVINNFCDFVKDCVQNGISQNDFLCAKNLLCSFKKNIVNQSLTTDSECNFDSFRSGYKFVDYDKVFDIIKNMSYQDFNSHLVDIFSSGNISLLIEGDYDCNHIPNLAQLQEKIGCNKNSHLKNSSSLTIEQSINCF